MALQLNFGIPRLQGVAPRDIAPNLYKLAWRKHKKVFEELNNAKWTRGLWRMSTTTEMAEFVDLWGESGRFRFY
jgi:hypothetical protein